MNTGPPPNGQNVQPDDWDGIVTPDLQQDGVWETGVDVTRNGLWFPEDLNFVAGTGDTYMAMGGGFRNEGIFTDSTDAVAAGDENVVEFSYVVTNSTATSIEGGATGNMLLRFGTDTVNVPLETPTDVEGPYWVTTSVTIAASQDYPAGTRFTMQATDGGYVAIDVLGGVPCFTAVTKIMTQFGEVDVETLEVGDTVMTRDHGFQPVRWVGKKKVPAQGRFAPIVFKKGAIGNHTDLIRRSVAHRM